MSRHILLLITLLMVTELAAAKPKPKPKNTTIPVEGVGLLRIRHSIPNEPIAQPERLEIFMTCANTKQTTRLQIYRMCTFDDYDYDQQTKTLYIKLSSGRVDPPTGDVKCDRVDMKQIELGNVCSAAAKNPPAPADHAGLTH